MWKWIHSLANPEVSYRFSGRLMPWFLWFAICFVGVGLIWGLLFSPADYQQGDTVRIFYVHVPASMLSMAVYLGMAITGFVRVVWQYKLSDAAIAAMAPVGACFTALALFTGAVWGKPMWGTWWEWDARLTSELILLFMYFGVIALQNAFEDKETGGAAASYLAIVGVINLPIIHYSVVWWNSLHQGSTVLKFGKPAITADMAIPFYLMAVGLIAFAGWIVMHRFQTEILRRNMTRPWVKSLVNNKER